jgi:hypothetical protein
LYLKDISNSANQVTALKSCQASKIIFAPDSKKNEILSSFFEAANTPMNFTDANWTLGVSNSIRAFFVGNTPSNRDSLKVGKTIEFTDGQEFEVTAIEISGDYINVFFDGDKFLPRIYGYPNKFKVKE